MLRKMIFGLVAAVVIPSAAAAQANKAIEDEVIRLTKAAWAGNMEKNTAASVASLADDYTEFNGDYATRIEGKALNQRLYEGDSKDSGKLLAAEMLNPKVQVYGNTAILTYNYAGISQDKDGKTTPSRAKSTRVYVKDGNMWKLVHANFAPDPLPQ
ncbi:MAG: nuclear transport factor 2 family protein [Gemmatimonadaceae bacterium]